MLKFYKMPARLRRMAKYARKGSDYVEPAPTPPPPPPNYSDQQAALWATNDAASTLISQMTTAIKEGSVAAVQAAQQNTVPNIITALDQQLALLKTAPTDATYYPQGTDRITAAEYLTTSKNVLTNLQNYVFLPPPPPPPPPSIQDYYIPPPASPPPPPVILPPLPNQTEILLDEINRQYEILKQYNRVFIKPIEPAQPEFIWPVGSWQYKLWAKGYNHDEISATETKIAELNLFQKFVGADYEWDLRCEELAQEQAIYQEDIKKKFGDWGTDKPLLPVCWPPLPPVVEQQVNGVTTVVPAFTNNPILTEDFPSSCATPDSKDFPIPVVCSFEDPTRRIVVQPNQAEFPDPRIPRKVKTGNATRRTKQFQKVLTKQILAREKSITMPVTPSLPFCGTGFTGKDWEGALLGSGASVSEMDTVRRMFAASKFQPGADLSAAALAFLDTVRGRSGVALQTVASQVALTNVLTDTPGVVRCGVSTTAVDRAHLLARRKEQKQRRNRVR